jgi:hypothetical protein
MIRRFSLFFGLLIGAMWTGEILFGNLGDTYLLGNFRTVHSHAFHLLVWSFIYAALVFTALSGLYTAYRTGNTLEGLQVAVWSVLISGLVVFVAGMGMTVLFLGVLRQSPSNLAEFARSGDQSISHFIFMDSLGGALNHLWIGPGLGLLLGTIGAFLGKVFHPRELQA